MPKPAEIGNNLSQKKVKTKLQKLNNQIIRTTFNSAKHLRIAGLTFYYIYLHRT
jgi:hypothetical protein